MAASFKQVHCRAELLDKQAVEATIRERVRAGRVATVLGTDAGLISMLGADLRYRAVGAMTVPGLRKPPVGVARPESTCADPWQVRGDPDSTRYAKVQAPTRALNRVVRSVTTGRSPVPMERPSSERMATISLAVPQRKASSAV